MNETEMGYLSILLLSVVCAMCTAGVLSNNFNDTLMQRIGLALVAIWCAARVSSKLLEPSTEAIHIMLHAGLAVYAIGTWLKLSRASREEPTLSVRILTDVQTRQVAGAGRDK